MNARPQPIPERCLTFTAWRNNRPVTGCPALEAATSLREAIDAVLPGTGHKTIVYVLQDDAGAAEKLLAIYTIRQESQAKLRRNLITGLPEETRRLYPELVHVLGVTAFAPVAPFDAFADDPVGVDRQLVVAK
jgi:hypothetical protein